MDFIEVFGGMLRRYGLLMLLVVALPMVAVGTYLSRQPATYTASARIVAADHTPQASAEASALVSQVQALATGRDVVSAALGSAKVRRDPDQAVRDITVAGLGTSAVVDISYTDRDPQAAQNVTAALADSVVSQLDAARLAGLPQALQQVDKQLSDLNTTRLTVATRAQYNTLDLAAQNRLADIDRQIADLTSERSRLADEATAVGHTSVVALPARPAHADPSAMAPMLAVAGLLGLVIGLIIIGVDHTMRPKVSGVIPVARLLDVPVLGSVGSDPAKLMAVGRCIRLAALRAGISTLVLTRPGHRPVPPELVDRIAAASLRPQPVPARVAVPLDVEAARLVGVPGADSLAARGVGQEVPGVLAQSVEATVGSSAVTVLPTADEAPRVTTLREVCALEELDPDAEFTSIGMVVLASGSHRLRAVDAVRNLVAASGWPVLGVLGEGRHPGQPR